MYAGMLDGGLSLLVLQGRAWTRSMYPPRGLVFFYSS
jgi:hypothetical protein